MVIPAAGSTKVAISSNGITRYYLYTGTVTLGDTTYFQMMPITKSGNPVYYQGLVKNTYSKLSDNATITESDLSDPQNYVSTEQQTLYQYEKSLYKDFGIKNLPFSQSVSLSRFSLYRRGVSKGNLYIDFKTKGSSKVNLLECSDSDEKLHSLSLKNFVTKSKIKNVNISAYVYLPTGTFYFTQNKNGSVRINNGEIIGVLNSRIFYSSLNNIIRDQIISEATNTIKVNKLTAGKRVYIGSLVFTMQSDGTLLSGPITPVDGSIANLLLAINNNNSKSIKSSLLRVFSGQVIACGGRSLSLSSYVTDVDVGKLISSDKDKILYKTGSGYYYKEDSENTKVRYSKDSAKRIDSFMLSIKVNDCLLCRPLDTDETLYQMLYITDAYMQNGLGNLPFYPEYHSDDKQSSIHANWQQTMYAVNQFAGEIKAEFLSEYSKAFNGDLISLVKLIVITILFYLSVTSFIFYFVLNYKIGYGILKAIAMPDRLSRMNNGIDLIRVLSFGIFTIDDKPRLAKIVLLHLTSFVVAYILLNYS